mgnify:CR=1 FL=1
MLANSKKNNYDIIEIPGSLQPRVAFGYLSSLLMLYLSKIKIITKNYTESLYKVCKKISFDSTIYSKINNKNTAINFAHKLFHKQIVIYTSDKLRSVGYRFKCQLAENSKIISSHFVFPEQNHNEIEAFQNFNVKDIAFIWLSDKDDDPRITNRMQITEDLLSNIGSHYSIEASSLPPNENSDRWTRILKMVSYVDWISYYCAILNNTDPTPVNKIAKLKGLL